MIYDGHDRLLFPEKPFAPLPQQQSNAPTDSPSVQCSDMQIAVQHRHFFVATRPDYIGKGSDKRSGEFRPEKGISGRGDVPQRITGKVGNLSVQTQIKLVEQYRSLKGKSGAEQRLAPGKTSTHPQSLERSGYRKVKEDARYQEELAQRKAAKRAEAHTKTLNSSRPTILVDGYNICGCAEGNDVAVQLKQLVQAGDLQAAQKYLIEELENFAVHCGYTIVCVFDADRAQTKEKSDQIYRAGPGIWVVFSVNNDADSWIEQATLSVLCGENSMEDFLQSFGQPRLGRSVKVKTIKNFKTKPPGPAGSFPSRPNTLRQLILVATNDNALRSIVRSNGAYVISAKALIDEMSMARTAEAAMLRDFAVKVKFGGERRGIGMFMRDSKIEDKLMALYLDAPDMDKGKIVKGEFMGKRKKGKKNKSTKPKMS